MGRLIDCNDVYNAIQITTDNFGVAKHVVETNMLTMLSEIPTVEAIPKADYENRLKADMVAMLEDLDLQIDESGSYNREVAKVQRLIRDKINKLKGEEDGTNEKTSDR